MSWEVHRREVADGDLATFEFSGDAGLVLYGIAKFAIQFASDSTNIGFQGSKINGFGVKLTRENDGGGGARELRVRATVSGNQVTSATVTIVAIAWIGATGGKRFVLESNAQQTATMSEPMAAGSFPTTSIAALRGFDLAFSSGDQSVISAGAASGIATSPIDEGRSYLTCAATLTGKAAGSGTTDVSGLVLSELQNGAWFGVAADSGQYTVTSENHGTRSITVDTGGTGLVGAEVLLQSFYGRWNGTASVVYQVEMGAGTPSLTTTPGQFKFDSTRWLTNIVNDTKTGYVFWDVAPTYSATYVWVALGDQSETLARSK